LEAPNVYVFGELLDLPNVQEVSWDIYIEIKLVLYWLLKKYSVMVLLLADKF
jgi:hypothetical protein